MIVKASRAFNPKNFVRKNKADDLQELFLNFNLPALDENNLEDDFTEKYNNCPDEIKEDFHLIYDVSSDKAMPLLIETSRELGIYYNDLTSYELAIKIFLENKQAFFNILNWHNINSLNNFKVFQGNKPKEPNHKNLANFEEELSEFFEEQARGGQIRIDKYPDNNKIAYVINYGEHAKRVNLFDDSDNFKTVKLRLANAITLIYHTKLSMLRVKSPDFPTLDKLKELFSRHLIEDEKFFEQYKNKNFFDLTKLLKMKKEDFKFNPADCIQGLEITRIEGYLTEDKKTKKILACRYGLLQQLEDLGEDLEKIKPYKVHIQFIFEGKNNKRTIVITEPNQDNLNDSPKDNIIRKYFKEWEIMSA